MSDDIAGNFLEKQEHDTSMRRLTRVYGNDIPEQLMPKTDYWDMAKSMAKSAASDFGRGMMELPQAVAGGAVEAVEETIDTVDSVGDWLSYNVGDVVYDEDGLHWMHGEELVNFEKLAKAKGHSIGPWQGQEQIETEIADVQMDSKTGQFFKDTAQFLAGFAGGGRVLKGLKYFQGAGRGAKTIRAATAGAISDGVAFDPNDPNVSDLIESYTDQYPQLKNPVTEYLSSNPSDGEAEKRFKRALEGVGVGMMVDGVVLAMRMVRNKRIENLNSATDVKSQTDQEFVENSVQSIENPLGDETGPLFKTHTVRESSNGAGDQAIEAASAKPDLSEYPDYQAKPEVKLAPPERRLVETPQGKFVALEDGSVDLGRIDESLAEATGKPPAPIRLAEGWDKPEIRDSNKSKGLKGIDAGDDGLGLAHIKARHEQDILSIKGEDGKPLYDSVEAFVVDVTQKYNGFAKGHSDRVLIGKVNGREKIAVVELEKHNDHYSVRTAGFRSKGWMKKQEGYRSVSPRDQADSPNANATSGPSSQGDNSILSKETLEVNMAALNTPEDIERLLAEVTEHNAKNIEANRRGVRSNAETKQAAEGLNMRVDTLLKRKTGDAFNAEEALAAREVHSAVVRQVSAMAEKVANTATATNADKVAFLRSLKVYQAVEAQISGVRAEAGRALQQFRIIPKGNAKVSDQISALLDSREGYKVDAAASALRDILRENPSALPDAVAQISKPKGMDMIYEIWINNLLSGPKTHVVNITSNMLVPLWTIGERAVAGAVRKAVGGDGVELQEAAYQLNGLVKGYRDGFRLAARAFRTGESSDVLQKIETAEHEALTAKNFKETSLGKGVNKVTRGGLDQENYLTKGIDLFGAFFRLPGRALMAEDELFRAVGYRMELHAQAARKAVGEGLEGDELSRRVNEIINDPPEEIQHLATHNSRYQTFTKELGNIGKPFQKVIHRTVLGRVIVPFIRTPTNIIKFFGERTPFALAHSGIRGDIKAGGARRDLALARIGLGSMVMASVADLTLEGHITGAGPTDKRQRKLWLDLGYQPYSVKFGDTWYSYNRLEPLGMLFGVGAGSAEIMSQAYEESQAQIDELAMAAVLSIVQYVSGKSMMTGVTNTIGALDDPSGASLNYYLSSLAGSLVPSAVRGANPDNVRRDNQGIVTKGGNRELDHFESILNNIKSRIPGYSDDLPPRRNLWGEVVHYPEGLGPDFISPISTSKQKQDSVNEELLRLGAPIGMPNKIVEGIRLNPHEYSRYVELSGSIVTNPEGRTLKQELKYTFKGPLYKNLNQDDRARVVRNITDKYRAHAKERLKGEFPALQSLIMRREKKEQ